MFIQTMAPPTEGDVTLHSPAQVNGNSPYTLHPAANGNFIATIQLSHEPALDVLH